MIDGGLAVQLNYQDMIFQFIGGLGIFLFGLKYMGDGLQKSAGDRLKDILNKFTSTPLRAVMAGIIVTVLIQSSSGTTVLVVGLVSAGFMTLKQAIGVIMGANVGTTITAFIIGFNIGAYALPIMGVGALLLFFSKRSFVNAIGQVIFGFGALFFGLNLMGAGMRPLENLPQFRDMMVRLSDSTTLGVLTGTGMTLVMQSSSATIGILQELYGHGSVTLRAALPILFGSNIGTTITAVIASAGASLTAKRTSAFHVIFNLLGTVFVLAILPVFTIVLVSISQALNLNPEMQLAFAHGIFNVLNVVVQFWFIDFFVKLVTRLIPGEERLIEYDPSHLDAKLLQGVPSVALNQARLEIGQMGKFVTEEFAATFNHYTNQDEESRGDVLKLEEVVNQIDHSLTNYVMKISENNLTETNTNEQGIILDVTKYLERIGDHCENIVKNIQEAMQVAQKNNRANKLKEETKRVFYDDDLVQLFGLVGKNIEECMQAFVEDDYKAAHRVIDREKEVNELERSIRNRYIARLNEGIGRPSDGILFVDIVSNLERISDHTVKIAKHTLGIRYPFNVNQPGMKKHVHLASDDA